MAVKDLLIEKAQRIVKEAGFNPGPIDGIPGVKTRNGLREFLNVKVPDDEIIVLDAFRKHWRFVEEENSNIIGTVIVVRPVKMLRYTGKMATLWIASNVYDSFIEGLQSWEELEDFRMTETLRTLTVQKSLKKRKPRLAATPGWSMHGHARAFDFDIRTVSSLIKFYRHMGKFGWYNIYSKPGNVVLCPRGREAWHLQRTDPPGIHKNSYMRNWAKTRGGLTALMRVTYKYDRMSSDVELHS